MVKPGAVVIDVVINLWKGSWWATWTSTLLSKWHPPSAGSPAASRAHRARGVARFRVAVATPRSGADGCGLLFDGIPVADVVIDPVLV